MAIADNMMIGSPPSDDCRHFAVALYITDIRPLPQWHDVNLTYKCMTHTMKHLFSISQTTKWNDPKFRETSDVTFY